MIIEITGTGVVNKGAQMLLIATLQAIHQRCPSAVLAVRRTFGPIEERVKYNLNTVIGREFPRREWWVSRMLDKILKDDLLLVSEREVNVVLDASGFAFGDQLGERRTLSFLKDVKRWRKQGKKIVLLPQALGSFENPKLREAFAEIVSLVDVVYARERQSLAYARSAAIGYENKIRLAPDFTNLVEVSGEAQECTKKVLIVPNFQVIAKSNGQKAAPYIQLLSRIYAVAKRFGLDAEVLIHDSGTDSKLIGPLCEAIGDAPSVIHSDDPLELKHILKEAKLVVGSRFHALVGALSQAVPVIAVGWSHKYEKLLEDYGLPDSMLTVESSNCAIAECIRFLEENSHTVKQNLTEHSKQQKMLAENMWNEVYSLIGI